MTLERLAQWSRRIYLPSSSSRVGLGWGAEYWDPDPTHYEGWAELRDLCKNLGRKRTKRELAVDLADQLLNEVIAAAGGVEYAIKRLRSAVVELKQWADENAAQSPIGLAHPAAIEVLYAFGDVLAWARAVEDRLKRRPLSRTMRDQGLVPALKPVRLRKRVEKLLKRLQDGPVGESRLLANFTLHAALVRSPFSGVQLTVDGAVRLPVPDLPPHPISHWKLLTWNDDRDGISLAEKVWESIQEFIDELLNAFEKAAPKRFRVSVAPLVPA